MTELTRVCSCGERCPVHGAHAIDVERLARALTGVEWHRWQSLQVDDIHTRNLARAIVREDARLAAEEAADD